MSHLFPWWSNSYPSMTQGHSAPRQLLKLYFEALTMGILRACPVEPRRLSCALPTTGSVQGLKIPTVPARLNKHCTDTSLLHLPTVPPPMALHCFLAFIPCKPSRIDAALHTYIDIDLLMQIPISIYIYLFFTYIFSFMLLMKCCAFNCCLPLHGLRSSHAPESQDGALGAPTCSSMRWGRVQGCPGPWALRCRPLQPTGCATAGSSGCARA